MFKRMGGMSCTLQTQRMPPSLSFLIFCIQTVIMQHDYAEDAVGELTTFWHVSMGMFIPRHTLIQLSEETCMSTTELKHRLG